MRIHYEFIVYGANVMGVIGFYMVLLSNSQSILTFPTLICDIEKSFTYVYGDFIGKIIFYLNWIISVNWSPNGEF